jgi:hypothetical protein
MVTNEMLAKQIIGSYFGNMNPVYLEFVTPDDVMISCREAIEKEKCGKFI